MTPLSMLQWMLTVFTFAGLAWIGGWMFGRHHLFKELEREGRIKFDDDET